ncbi:MAG: hypothetical protein AAB660_02870 [Patescibacteria group bacterium]
MKKIGQGLQYKVFDLGNGRVLKKCISRSEARLKLISWGELRPTVIERDIENVFELRKDSIGRIFEKLGTINAEIIGNPEIFTDLGYKQDKVIPLGEYFSNHSVAENELVIDKYVENIFETWKYGFSDIIFNFTINNGVDSKGNVILIDLGELSFNKDEVAKCVVDQKWLKQHSCTTLHNEELKSYFISIMLDRVTLDGLNKYWPN